MMNISCQVVRDLLPLYHDNVCSEDSRAMVEEHLRDCPACSAELKTYDAEPAEKKMDEARLIAGTAKAWKNKAAAFFKGALIVAVLACVACLVAYNAIGSHIAPDGTLVEAFGFIPLAWLFALLSLIFGVCLILARHIPKKK